MDTSEHKIRLLSARERQVAELAAVGLTDKAVAERLGLSPHTIGRHWRNIREKLNASSRTEAVALLQKDLGDQLKRQLSDVQSRIDLAIEAHRLALTHCHRQQDRLVESVAMLKGERLPPEGFIFFDDEELFKRAYTNSHYLDLRRYAVKGGGLTRYDGLSLPPLHISGGGENPYRFVVIDWDDREAEYPRPCIQFDRPSDREGQLGCLSFAFDGDVYAFGLRLASRIRWARVQDVWRIEVASESHSAREYALSPCSGSVFFGVRCTEPLRSVRFRPSETSYGLVGAIRWAGAR